jgi:anthranilate phosphoribosyltransferase
MTLAGVTHATEVGAGGAREKDYRPEDFGLTTMPLDSIRVTGPAESAAIVRSVLAGEHGPARDIVVLNAAAGLMTFNQGQTPLEAASRAAEAIDSRAAADVLRRLTELSHAE